MGTVQTGQQLVSLGLALRGDEAAGSSGKQIGDGRSCAGIDDGALMLGRQERGVPVLGAVAGEAAMIGQHDERRQVLVHAAQTVTDPAAHAGKPRKLEAGRLKIGRLAVNAGLADHVVDKRHVIHATAERGRDLAEHLAAAAIGLELPQRTQPGAETVLERLDVFAEIGLFAVMLDQGRLVIEQVDVTGAAGHE